MDFITSDKNEADFRVERLTRTRSLITDLELGSKSVRDDIKRVLKVAGQAGLFCYNENIYCLVGGQYIEALREDHCFVGFWEPGSDQIKEAIDRFVRIEREYLESK